MINSDDSIKINIKFAFTVHEYIIVYEFILLSNLIYNYICPQARVSYTIYTHMNFVFFVYCNLVATHTYDGHTAFKFI